MRAYLILKAIEGSAAIGEDGKPGEFQVLPYGTVEIEGEEDAFVDDEAMDAIVSEFTRRGNDMVIDYEHQTLTGQEAPAAGWLKTFVKKGAEGLWAVVEWTEKAREYLASKEYRYFSPVFWVRKADRKIIAIDNLALTNFPKINNLKPITAKMNSDFNNRQGDPAYRERERKENIMLEKLKKLFGLADDAGEDKVVEAVETVVAKAKTLEEAAGGKDMVACKEVLEALGLKEDAKKEDAVTAIAGLKVTDTAAADLSQQVATLTAEIAEMKKGDLTALALKEGKTSPEELEKWGNDLALKSPDQFTRIVLSRPAGSVIPVQVIPPGPKDNDGDISDAALTIAKQLGNTEEDLKKYGGVAKEG